MLSVERARNLLRKEYIFGRTSGSLIKVMGVGCRQEASMARLLP